MTDILRKFLLDDARRLGSSGTFIGLAAFGKHPGWDDHVEDLGLESDSLNQAKSILYVNGIGGQIDAGVWEKLEANQQLPEFKHLFLWQRSGQILLGRLWSSSDGKGRKRYPMVLCLHFIGVTLRWALAEGLPALEELQEKIQSTNSAEEVRSLLQQKRAALRALLGSADGRGEYAPIAPEAMNHIFHADGDGKANGFLRVLYQMDSQFKPFTPAMYSARAKSGLLRAQQIRVPLAAKTPEQAFLFWTRFFLAQLDPSVPLLMTLPLHGDWVDVTAGDPESHEFFCLRASPKSVPLVSEIPYNLEEPFVGNATAFLDSLKRGEGGGTRPSAEPATAGGPAPAKGKWLKWLGVGLFAIFGLVSQCATWR